MNEPLPWLSLGPLSEESSDFSKYANDIGIYRAVLNGDVVYIGKATELNNGGFRKRLRDYTRKSPSARNYPAGELIFSNRNGIHIDIIIFDQTLDSIPHIEAMEIELINTVNPPWNKHGRK